MNEREEQILRVLGNSVRVMTLNQVARYWWSDTRWGRSRAKNALGDLADHELLHLRQVLSRPIERLMAPLVNWRHDRAEPNFESLARQLHKRAMKPAALVTVVFAARKTNAILGSGRLPTIKLTQITHDLHVAEVFQHYQRRGLAKTWMSEDDLPPAWSISIRPDAVLQDENGKIVHAVEYAGDYQAERFAELHIGLSHAGLSYEIW